LLRERINQFAHWLRGLVGLGHQTIEVFVRQHQSSVITAFARPAVHGLQHAIGWGGRLGFVNKMSTRLAPTSATGRPREGMTGFSKHALERTSVPGRDRPTVGLEPDEPSVVAPLVPAPTDDDHALSRRSR
jgi:hypothetical protein